MQFPSRVILKFRFKISSRNYKKKNLWRDICSQLYRSGSFNSSGMGSNYDATDDVYSDVSLEDVMDLSHKVSKTTIVYK